MQKLYLIAFLIFSVSSAWSQDFEEKLYEDYQEYKEPEITNRRFKHALVTQLLDKHRDGIFKIQQVGESIEGRSLNLVSIGTGETQVFLWSQMHGDESTATMAIFDILNFFESAGFEAEKELMLSKLSIHFLPMLNPDGAEVFHRRNALGVDINRDALRLQSPESQTLKRIRDSLDADFGFNLHDQSRYYNAERTAKPATISFLATAYNYEKEINDVRARSMQLIVQMNKVLQNFAPGQVGRYNDDFEPRAFGDNIQKWGTSLMLIESGGFAGDREKQEIRKLNFVVILSALKSIASKSYEKEAISDYEKIPENDRMLFDLKLKNLNYELEGNSYILDLGINRNENAAEHENGFYYTASVEDQGDLSTSYGYEELDAQGLTLEFPKIYPDLIETEEALGQLNVSELLKQGYAYVRTSEELRTGSFSNFPLNMVSEDFQLRNILQPGISANFILRENGEVKFAIINGFLTEPANAEKNILNSRNYN